MTQAEFVTLVIIVAVILLCLFLAALTRSTYFIFGAIACYLLMVFLCCRRKPNV